MCIRDSYQAAALANKLVVGVDVACPGGDQTSVALRTQDGQVVVLER